MEEKDFIGYHEWGIRVSRLMELIAMTNRTIQVHREEGDSELYIKQYEEVLERHTDELQELMKVMGLAVQLTPLSNVA
ncbi:hypothetical protein [Emticicia sp. C21]|uniref:hypothetical protein n=1 Tax=Emticicia sp. C21 TaxID=2302915 RepID=UPI000E34DA5A|nr:hypothetical protein [Emticicia sp. C21]RFS16605.1 hypothetical protein D0T08_07920 [Emticicia sp. C21]